MEAIRLQAGWMISPLLAGGCPTPPALLAVRNSCGHVAHTKTLMAILVYVTENCREEAQRHALQDELERFKDRVEKVQSTRLFEPFPPTYLVKKKFGGRQGRLIARQHNLGDNAVIALLSVMIRGDSAYEDGFSRNHTEYGKRHFEHLYTEGDLAAFVHERTKTAPVPEKPAPTNEEYGYLLQALAHRQDVHLEDIVCESIDWVMRSADTPFKNWHASLYDAISKVQDDDRAGGKLTLVPGKPGWSILSRHFPSFRLRLLIAPIIESATTSLNQIRSRYEKVLYGDGLSLETILQSSRRAYPALILADGDLWMDLEKEEQANMALSPEETKLLDAARRSEGGFPLFINGRAGSGKTTILQYLFAEYLFYHLTEGGVKYPPVYFTCNDELLRQSRRTVENLLRCNAQWWHVQDRDRIVENNSPVLDAAFKEFHAHLLSLVKPADRSQLFPAGKYVSFARFKQLWRARFGKEPSALKEFGPDLSWHVIRSYVKGLSTDELLDPEEYRQLDQKQITVTQKSYEIIYDKVWSRWYHPLCQNEHYWDDQDLARHLVEADAVKPVYPAMFCDEAQDFTRVELDIILRLSLFSERKLAPEFIGRVPFVFAGDQFQTLNPTGFRWDAIKASFVEKFIFALDPERRSRLDDLNYQELTYNYRSSRSIVRFSNFVQALRARLFELPGLKPQEPWENEINPPPVTRFLRENDEFWNRLKRETDVVMIVPCGEGEELDFIRDDTVLSVRLKVEDGAPQMTVLSPNRAKGLEFARVVVYGFGEKANPALLDPIRGKSVYAGDPDRALPFQYFINGLYVAVSRAKRRLFIADSEQGFKRLWAFAQDESLERSILDGLRDGHETWSKTIARIELGRPDDLSLDRARDPLENAATLARDGRARRDAYLLLSASVSYRNAGQVIEADRCKAEALRLEAKFFEAGEIFLTCGDAEKATECFWEASRHGWREIVKAAEEHPLVNQKLEFAFARALTTKQTMIGVIDLLQRLTQRLEGDEARASIVTSPAWALGVRALLDEIITLEASPDELLRGSTLVEKLVVLGFPVTASPRARLHFRAGQLARAVELWESIGERDSLDYKTAKAFSSPFPEKIAPLHELGKHDQIVADCDAHPHARLSPDQRRMAGLAYLNQGRFDQAFELLVTARDVPGVALFVLRAQEAGDFSLAHRGIAALFAVAAAKEDWSGLLSYVQHGQLPRLERPPHAFSSWLARERPVADVSMARALGRSSTLANLPWDKAKACQRPFAEWLRRSFLSGDRKGAPVDHFAEIGAAVERAGNRQDSLVFYETLREDERRPATLRRNAQERWIVCKERQARHESESGGEKLAVIQMVEATEARKRLGLPIDYSIPSYPSLSSMEHHLDSLIRPPPEPAVSTVQPVEEISHVTITRGLSAHPAAEQTANTQATDQSPKVPGEAKASEKWTVGNLRIEFFREYGRINISDGRSGATAFIKLTGKTCSGDDVNVVQDATNAHRFSIPDWELIAEFSTDDRLLLEVAAEGFSRTLNLR